MTLAPTLTRLATWLDELDHDLKDSAIMLAIQSQTGVRSTTTGRPTPCNLTKLDEKLDVDDEVMDIVSRAAGRYLPAAKRKQGSAACCRWLAVNLEVLDQAEDADQIAEDICSMEQSLFRAWNREVPASHGSHWLTNDQVVRRLARFGKTAKPDTIRRWNSRDRAVRAQIFSGTRHFWWPDIQRHIGIA